MRQISRNLVVFMSTPPCTSNYETGSYVVRVKVMSIFRLTKKLKLQDTGKKITFLELEIESSNHLAKNESEDRSRRK